MSDGARRRALEEERDFLLRSIEDLDAEHAAGDLSDADHARLRDDYVARAAEALRALDAAAAAPAAPEPGQVAEPEQPEGTEGSEGSRQEDGRPSRRLVWVAGSVVFAVVAGLILANVAGERGASDTLTGGLDESLRDTVLECEQLGAQGEMQAALQCFDEVLAEDPQFVEALTYRGWYLYLTAQSAAQSGAEDLAVELMGRALENLTSAIEVNPQAPEARTFRAVIYNRLGETEASCADLAVLDEIEDVAPMITQLTANIAATCP